jgi:hypothetical protein
MSKSGKSGQFLTTGNKNMWQKITTIPKYEKFCPAGIENASWAKHICKDPAFLKLHSH